MKYKKFHQNVIFLDQQPKKNLKTRKQDGKTAII